VHTSTNRPRQEKYKSLLRGSRYILYLNETCKAYATRDILIQHRIETDTELVDFIPNSRIKEPEDRNASLTTNIMENKHVRTNHTFDLNLVAKSTSEIKEMVIKDVKTEQIRNSKRRHDYLLYVISAITIICVAVFIIKCIEQKPWCTITGTTRTRQDIRPDHINYCFSYPIDFLHTTNNCTAQI